MKVSLDGLIETRSLWYLEYQFDENKQTYIPPYKQTTNNDLQWLILNTKRCVSVLPVSVYSQRNVLGYFAKYALILKHCHTSNKNTFDG